MAEEKPAARQFDPIAHSMAMAGLIAGALAGAAIGALVVSTGGLALAAAVALGASAGAGIGEVLGSLSALPKITTGTITTGSPNVFINGIPAARAHVDTNTCSGMPATFSMPHTLNPIAQGSSNVFINGMPAARVGDQTACGGVIKSGSGNVFIGGGTQTTDSVAPEVPKWLNTVIAVVGIAAAVVVAGPVVAAIGLAGSYLGGEAGAWAGGKLFGEGSDGQKLMALGGAIVGGAAVGGLAEGEVTEPVNAKEPVGVTERCSAGDPVDVVTGEVLMWKTDFVLPGALPVELNRCYASRSRHTSCFGPRWTSSWGQYVRSTEGKATFYAGDGRRIVFEIPGEEPSDWVGNATVNKVRLRRVADGFEVRDEDRRILRFAGRRFAGAWLLSAMEDVHGNSIQFRHDDEGALREVVHSGGYRLAVEGTAKQIQRVTLDGAELVRYEYDAAGMLVAVIDGSGLPFQYRYDARGRATRWEDRKGTWYEYRLDDCGRCVEARGPGGFYHYRFLYNPAEQTTVAIDSLEQLTIYRYNEQRRVVERRDARGGFTSTEWDERGNVLQETDPAGRTSVRQYDADGNLTSVEDGLGRKTSIEYNAAGFPVKLVDADGKEWSRSYDERGNLIAATGPDGKTWTYRRDARGNLARVEDPEGRGRKFSYDERGLLESWTDWKFEPTYLTRDAQGRVTERVDLMGRRTQFTYDNLGKLAETVRPDGSRTRWEYDPEGNLTRSVGPDGGEFAYRYGAFDVLAEVTKPSGAKLQLRYDTEARLRRVQNELDQTWTYEYNPTGQVAREVDFHGREQHYEYDGSGLCSKRVNGAGEETLIERDAAGQVVHKVSSDGSQTEFVYDALGRVTRAVADGVAVKFERDAYGRVLRESQGGRQVVESEYDARGLRVRRMAGGIECKWTWDLNGQTERLRVDGTDLIEFAHDAGGREVERKMRGGVVLRQEFDALDRLKSQWAGDIQREYSYDANGDPMEILDKQWGLSRFGYDADGRIQSAERERGGSEHFAYDAEGNMRARALEYDDGGMGQRTANYDENGRLVRMGQNTYYAWDADGRLAAKQVGEGVWRYEWSTEGRLRAVETPTGERWQYAYDAFGRRVKKTGPTGTTEYVWDGATVAEEIRKNRVYDEEVHAAWVWEPGSFRPLVKQEGSRTYMCVTDQVGTPRALVGTDDGRVAWSAKFSTWGEAEESRTNQTECPVRFEGQWFDSETGLHYNYHRYYDPGTGSYISPDPIGLMGGIRSYGYAANPLSWIDPWGLACKMAGPRNELGQLTDEAHGQLKPGDQGFKTTALGRYDNGQLAIASSDTVVPPAQRAWAESQSITPLRGEGHAEETLLGGESEMGGKLTQVEVNRPICLDCENNVIRPNEIQTETPFSGLRSRSRR